METARLHPIYITLSSRNNQLTTTYDQPDPITGIGSNGAVSDDATFYAHAIINSTYPLLQKAADYICFVERMEVSGNGIPFYDASNTPDPINREYITIRYKHNLTLSSVQPVDLNAYSLSHLFDILNSYDYEDPGPAADIFSMTFSINKDGFIVLTLLDGKSFTDLQVEIPPRLNQILGISTNQQFNGYNACSSLFPRIDLGDDLDHLVIQTNLPTVSDQIGNIRLNVLTDFSSPTAYSNSLSYGADGQLTKAGFSTSIRQKIIYNPSQRRYIDLTGEYPINEITCDLYYVNNEEKSKRVPLPYGGSFELKLGFYLRNG